MFANLDNDLTFNFSTAPGSAYVEIARLCSLDNSTIAFSKDMNLFVMYPDVKTIINNTGGFQYFRFVKRDILAIERIRIRDATHLTFIQAISQVKEPDGTKLGWQRARRVLGNYHPDTPIESFQYQVERNGVQHALIAREFTEHLTAVNLNLENGPIPLDEKWRDACRDRAKENHMQGWNGLPGIRYKKKRRFKSPEGIADGDGFIFHKTN